MAWRNGAGRTTEIESYPTGAALDAFDWRISIADVARDAPFSRFPGIDRTIVVIAGAGMRLQGDGDAVLLQAFDAPYSFSGNVDMQCTLVDGPVRDFNLMLRRGRVRGGITVVRHESARIAPARFRFCYTAIGNCKCVLERHPSIAVPMDHALRVEEPALSGTQMSVEPLTADTVALAVTIALIDAE